MRYYFLTILVSMVAITAFSQVSMDNEDGVAKIDAMRARHDFVPGQVLVKFSDANRVTLSRSRGMVTTNLNRVSNVLSKYGVADMEKLLPNENPNRQLRKSRAFNGETIQERDLSQLYLRLEAVNAPVIKAEAGGTGVAALGVSVMQSNEEAYSAANVTVGEDQQVHFHGGCLRCQGAME